MRPILGDLSGLWAQNDSQIGLGKLDNASACEASLAERGSPMPTDAFRVSTLVSALPERVFSAWMDSGAHTAFTGGEAKIDAAIGGRFSAWDGYIQGRTVDLLQGRRIVQTWRTKEFPQASADSRLEVQFESAEGGTRITILHSNIPEGQGERYKTGWTDHYFTPMREYFARLLAGPDAPNVKKKPSAPAKPAPRKLEAKKAAPKKSTATKVGGKKPARPNRAKAAAKRPARKAKGRKR
jgi:uncharacterized protein YndB with AHSA1/START domain